MSKPSKNVPDPFLARVFEVPVPVFGLENGDWLRAFEVPVPVFG